jgi:hypothetical protein
LFCGYLFQIIIVENSGARRYLASGLRSQPDRCRPNPRAMARDLPSRQGRKFFMIDKNV